jgi:hypothetical protein
VLPDDVRSSFYSQAAFRTVAPILYALPEGTDLFSLLGSLGAAFVTHDFGESHNLLAPGFLNTREVRTQTLLQPEGLYKLRPFGWLVNDVAVVDRIAIFRNDRLLHLVPNRGLANWAGYLDSVPGSSAVPSR